VELTPINAIVIGAPRSGKTYATRALLSGRSRVVYYDPAGDVQGVYVDRNPEALAVVVRERPVYDAVLWSDHLKTADEHARALGTLYDAAEQHPAWVTVVIDELYVVTGDKRRPLAELQQRIRVSKHPNRRVSVWILSQRAADAGPNWQTVMDRILIFRTAGVSNYNSLKDNYGRPVAEAVRELGPHEFVDYDVQTGEWSVQDAI